MMEDLDTVLDDLIGVDLGLLDDGFFQGQEFASEDSSSSYMCTPVTRSIPSDGGSTSDGEFSSRASPMAEMKNQDDVEIGTFVRIEETEPNPALDDKAHATRGRPARKRRGSNVSSDSSEKGSGKRKKMTQTKPKPLNKALLAKLSAEEVKKIKEERKRERNKVLAKESRDRKKQLQANLQQENIELKAKIKDLETQLKYANEQRMRERAENEELRKRLNELEGGHEFSAFPPIEPLLNPYDVISPKVEQVDSRLMVDDDEDDDDASDKDSLIKGARMGSAAMVASMGMILFTDTTSDAGSYYSPPASSGADHMIGFWAVGWDLVKDSGLATFIPNHFVCIIFGVTLTLTVMGLFYYRMVHAIRKPVKFQRKPCSKSSSLRRNLLPTTKRGRKL